MEEPMLAIGKIVKEKVKVNLHGQTENNISELLKTTNNTEMEFSFGRMESITTVVLETTNKMDTATLQTHMGQNETEYGKMENAKNG